MLWDEPKIFFLERRYFFSIILSEFLKNRVALHKLDETEYYLDILCAGDSHERAEVVSYLLADGRLDKLKEKINGRDAA